MLCNLPFRIVTISALILNLAAGPTILSAQQAPADVPTITIRANTRLVVVDVVVTHKNCQPFAGLKPEDFPVEQNGKKQEGSVFVPPSIAQAGLALQAVADLKIGYNIERRTMITLDAMRALSRMLGGLPGRKNVVWLTADLPFDLIPEDRSVTDAELMADLPGQGRQRSVDVNAASALAGEQRNLHGQAIRAAEAEVTR